MGAEEQGEWQEEVMKGAPHPLCTSYLSSPSLLTSPLEGQHTATSEETLSGTGTRGGRS